MARAVPYALHHGEAVASNTVSLGKHSHTMDHHTITRKFPAPSVFDSALDTLTQASMWSFLRLTQGTQVLAQALIRSTHVVAAHAWRGLYCICRDSEILYCRSPHPLTEQGPTPSALFLVHHWQMLSSRVWQGPSTRQRRAR